jgi:hypothetical protein
MAQVASAAGAFDGVEVKDEVVASVSIHKLRTVAPHYGGEGGEQRWRRRRRWGRWRRRRR